MDMDTTTGTVLAATHPLADSEIVHRVQTGDTAFFEVLMRRYNHRLYRVARSVVQDEDEAEDVMQQAYINAFTHLAQFEGRSSFSSWITRITLNEAFARRRARQRQALREGPQSTTTEDWSMDTFASPRPDPERQTYAGEVQRVIEQAVDALPEIYRVVFMMRDVEGLSTAETGEGLGLGDEAVKTRLHRARSLVRRTLTDRLGSAAREAFAFPATRCDRVVAAVMARLNRSSLIVE